MWWNSRQRNGIIGDTFGGWYVWSARDASLLIDHEMFWILAEALLSKRSPRLLEAAKAEMKDSTPRIASERRRRIRERFLLKMAAKLRELTRTRSGWDWLADLGVPTSWNLETGSGDRTWMAALDWYAAGAPEFSYYKVNSPEPGVALAFQSPRGPDFDWSEAIFLSEGQLERVWARADRMVFHLSDGALWVVGRGGFRRARVADIPMEEARNFGLA